MLRNLVLLLPLATVLSAQHMGQPPLPSGPTGTVVGTVTMAGSRLPARFVPIVLVPAPGDAAADPKADRSTEVTAVRGTTGIDGSFHLEHVPTGDYLIGASLPGALNAAPMSVYIATDEQVKAMLSAYLTVSVAAGSTTSTQLVLRLGATISGRLQYADGAPVISGQVSLNPEDNPLLHLSDLGGKTATPRQQALFTLASIGTARMGGAPADDTGHFRIYGVPPGKYTLATSVVVDHATNANVTYNNGRSSNEARGGLGGEAIPIYAPSSLSPKDARVFEIHGDEQITDADITIDPQGGHTLRGKILTSDTHRPGSGSYLTIRDTSAKELGRPVFTEADGSFQFTWLPPGTYTLHVQPFVVRQPSGDGETQPPSPPVRYKLVNMTVVITDHDVVLDDILLLPAKPDDPWVDPF